MDLNAELAVGNIVSRVLHIIREEDISLTSSALEGLGFTAGSDDDESHIDRDDHYLSSSPAVAAAAARSALRAPSLHTLLEGIPDSVSIPNPSSSGGDSEGRSKCSGAVLFL